MLDTVQSKLKYCSKELKKWSKNLDSERTKVIKEKSMLLDQLQQNEDPCSMAARKQLQRDIDFLLDQEDIKWKERAKKHWLEKGDRNTKFYHACVNQRKKNNSIQKVVTAEGVLLTEPGEILLGFGQHFSQVFLSTHPPRDIIMQCLAGVDTRISDDMRLDLERGFSSVDVLFALKQMSPFKSLGADGFSAGFFLDHWDIVGTDVSNAVLEFLSNGVMPAGLNHTLIALNEKSADYGYLMEPKCFYPRVEWDFLEAMMLKLGFGNKWTGLIMTCVKSVTYSVKVNGVPGISSLFQQAERDGLLKVVAASRGGMPINHLLFAGDYVIFYKAKHEEWNHIEHILWQYECASGHTLKKQKTSILFSSNTVTAARELIIESTNGVLCGNYNKWLPQPLTYRVQTPINRLPTDSTVVELIDADSLTWKTDLVEGVFNSNEALQICSIPLSLRNNSDQMIWVSNAKGVFSVKSAYFLDCLIKQQFVGEASNGVVVEELWRNLWQLHVPGNIKHFLWKALTDILPTKQVLLKRQIVEDGLCPICQSNEENVIHVLWNCSATMDVWGERESPLNKWCSGYKDFRLLWLDMVNRLDVVQLDRVAVILYKIWARRNYRPLPQINAVEWRPLADPFYKLNFDDAFDYEKRLMGIGIVVRNSRGEVLAVVSAPKSHVCSAFSTECYALLRSIKLCHELCLYQVVLEGDAKVVVDSFNGYNNNHSWQGLLIEDIQFFMKGQADWSLKFTKRP
ncbi:uncharacterized protein LOC118349461 [Juglans regia]|uniref:Uncharacterized protein LOC118349461 n=1 Tax=Juglans regia TaxID=51240 RepID=A0A6P9ERZ9_JUGRE|nr:uncharacterized protein LOC118349461 [Juglans regia]